MRTISKKVGELIKEKRIAAGLTQTELEKISGLKKEVVWQIEVGKTIPIERTIWRVCAALCLHRREIHEFLNLARQQRKNRGEFQKEYARKRARKLISRYYPYSKDQDKN
ncbi:helix-turn-helix protein [delta proteobacterium NaphS2]|nr:helix-turn-helix protein [delta proteobacterium NaphS2]